MHRDTCRSDATDLIMARSAMMMFWTSRSSAGGAHRKAAEASAIGKVVIY
jgi:hypothetical protein